MAVPITPALGPSCYLFVHHPALTSNQKLTPREGSPWNGTRVSPHPNLGNLPPPRTGRGGPGELVSGRGLRTLQGSLLAQASQTQLRRQVDRFYSTRSLPTAAQGRAGAGCSEGPGQGGVQVVSLWPQASGRGKVGQLPTLGSLQGPGQAEGFTVSVVWTLEGWGAGHAQTRTQG